MKSKALNHFKKTDPVLYQAAITLNLPANLVPSDNFFVALCENIIGQQLSNKVEKIINARFRDLLQNDITPPRILKLSPDDLRNIGISYSKAGYILDLAEKVNSNQLDLHSLKNKSDIEVIAELTEVKGIGPWTAEMFLMFTLGREDVFSFGDLGLRRGIQKLYQMENEPTIQEMERISLKWKPYRTYAALVLWKMQDG